MSHRIDSAFVPLPEGQRVQDVLPQFSEVRHELPIGTPGPHCAGCRKSFTVARKRRLSLRLYPAQCPVPIAFQYHLCGCCAALYKRGGEVREAVVSAVEAYHLGAESQ